MTLVLVGLAAATAVHDRSPPLSARDLLVDMDADRIGVPASSDTVPYMVCDRWGRDCTPLGPVVMNHGDQWIAHDFLGISKIEIDVEADPDGARTKLRAWVRSICDGQPHGIHLRYFEHPTEASELERLIESECPSLEVPHFQIDARATGVY